MAITQEFLAQLAAARMPLIRLAQLAAEERAELELCKLAIRDPLNPEFIIGYQLVISVAGTLQLCEELEQLILSNVSEAKNE